MFPLISFAVRRWFLGIRSWARGKDKATRVKAPQKTKWTSQAKPMNSSTRKRTSARISPSNHAPFTRRKSCRQGPLQMTKLIPQNNTNEKGVYANVGNRATRKVASNTTKVACWARFSQRTTFNYKETRQMQEYV